MIVKLPFSESAVETTTLNSGHTYFTKTIKANSIFDPDNTAGQPRWHDQWATMYNRYYVRRCTVKWRIMNTANSFGAWFYTAIVPYRAGAGSPYIVANINSALMSDVKELAKRPGHRFYPKLHKPPGAGQGILVYDSRSIVPAFWLDGKDRQTDNSAAFGADPPQVVNMDINMHSLVDASVRTYYMEIMVEYEVCMYDPKDPGPS